MGGALSSLQVREQHKPALFIRGRRLYADPVRFEMNHRGALHFEVLQGADELHA